MARIAREGRHLSVITYAAMVYTALEAAEHLERDGLSVRVVNVSTLKPADHAALPGAANLFAV